jgi:hypothetical protein
MPQFPGIGFPPDSATSLWRDISRNFFEIAVANGYSGTLEPNALDNKMSAIRKACFYSAYIVDNS